MTSLLLHRICQIRLIVRSKLSVHKKTECMAAVLDFKDSHVVRILQTIMNSFEGGQSCDYDGSTSAKLSRTLSGHQESSGTAFSLGFVTKIELENFMCHSSLVLEPGPCINLITGRNGAGKSSLIQVHWIAYFSESISNTEFFKNYRIHLTHEGNFQETSQFFPFRCLLPNFI